MRRSQLNSRRVSKYLLYAMGEIVVIGILIALQINYWNQQAEDRKKEKEYLVDIKKDLLTDTVNLNLVLAEVEKNLDAVVTLIKFINQPTTGPYDTVKIYNSIRYAGSLMSFATNSPTYDDLRSTGNLKVIFLDLLVGTGLVVLAI